MDQNNHNKLLYLILITLYISSFIKLSYAEEENTDLPEKLNKPKNETQDKDKTSKKLCKGLPHLDCMKDNTSIKNPENIHCPYPIAVEKEPEEDFEQFSTVCDRCELKVLKDKSGVLVKCHDCSCLDPIDETKKIKKDEEDLIRNEVEVVVTHLQL